MKKSKMAFIIVEIVLAVIALTLTVMMLRENYAKQHNKKVSVIIQNSGDNQWAAFKYGLKMAAADLELDEYVVNIGLLESASELQEVIEEEIENGADAVIVQPVSGEETGKMLQKMQGKVPIILVESALSQTGDGKGPAVVEPDQYALGEQLANELLEDYEGKLDGKIIGIVAQAQDTEAVRKREQGFRDTLQDSGAEISWSVTGLDSENGEETLSRQTSADIIIALDNNGLVVAGACAKTRNLRDAVFYGIGHSTDALHYLDDGTVECLVMPDEFQLGYQSMAEIAERLSHSFYKARNRTVDYTVVRRKTMFSKENQEMMFMMSQ